MEETFGQRFARLRKEKGFTQEDIAEKVHISAQAISKWENDISSPDISILIFLTDLLGVTLDTLLGKETEKSNEMTILPVEDRKPFNKLTLKVLVDTVDGDKVRVNLPMSLIKICLETGMKVPEINGSDAFQSINFQEIINLVEQGLIGKLVEVESAQGDTVVITVE